MRVVDSGLGGAFDLISWGEVKAYLRLRVDDDQTTLMRQMRAATLQIEKRSNIVLVERTFTIYFEESDEFNRENCSFKIPLHPVDATVAPTLSYLSGIASNAEVWTAYSDFFLTSDTPTRLHFTDEAATPDFFEDFPRWKLEGVTAGFADGDCPDALRMAVLLQLDATYNAVTDADRLIGNAIAPLSIHGNAF